MAYAFLIAGAGGMLGTALRQVLGERGTRFEAPSESEFDITDTGAVSSVVRGFAGALRQGESGVLVNAAAYTNVERAEDDAATAHRVNEDGARLLAGAARDSGLRFVHVSTDFVFDGTKSGAYVETDEPNPLSVYGRSKLAGECAVAEVFPRSVIVRTAWVFGPAGLNFPTKILELAASPPSLSVVTDEVGSPTYTIDLARGILSLVEAGATGLFHLANAGSCSRFEMAAAVLASAGLTRELLAVNADAYPSKAPRPKNSVLDCSKAAALGIRMPPWRDALERFIQA